MNNYLKCLRRKNPDVVDEQEQDEVVAFLEMSKPEKSGAEWFELFIEYWEKKWHLVCLWIINNRYLTITSELLKSESPELVHWTILNRK